MKLNQTTLSNHVSNLHQGEQLEPKPAAGFNIGIVSPSEAANEAEFSQPAAQALVTEQGSALPSDREVGKSLSFETAIDKVKYGLVGFGAVSHALAAMGAASKATDHKLPVLTTHEPLLVNVASNYSKYLSPLPLALNAIKKLSQPQNFWRGIAELSPLAKMLAGHVSNLPFFTGFLAGYNAYDKQIREFFEENPEIIRHEAKSESRKDHLIAIMKNLKAMLKHSYEKLSSGGVSREGLVGLREKFKYFSRLVVVPGFGLPFFYGMFFGRGEKLNFFIHKLIRWGRSAIGMVADADKVFNAKDPFVRKLGAAFFLDSFVNSFSPWLENNRAAVDTSGNISAAISETGNFIYSTYLQEQKNKEAAAKA